MIKRKLLIFLTIVIVILSNTALSMSIVTASGEPKRKVIVVCGKRDIDSVLKKVKHKKLKDFRNLHNAAAVMLDDSEIKNLSQNSDVKIYDDCAIKAIKIKSASEIKKTQIIPWGISSIGANMVWKNTTGKGIKIAIIDSGIDIKHPDLRRNVKGWFNAIEPGKLPIDDYGHGTHIAGIIAAKNNRIGVVGVAPDAELYSVKVLDQYGDGYLSDLAEGIEWCINNRIQVINMSFGIPNDMPLLYDSILKARQAGIIVVAAAGNNYGGSVDYPAAYKEVISVSAIDESENLANFSSVGKIDVCAPGVNIYSTYLNSGYEYLDGTSMAAPHVTGIIALLLQNNRNYSQEKIRRYLEGTSKDLGEPGKDSLYGLGLVNINDTIF